MQEVTIYLKNGKEIPVVCENYKFETALGIEIIGYEFQNCQGLVPKFLKTSEIVAITAKEIS